MDPTFLWEALKAVIRRKLTAQQAALKRNILELYTNLTGQLKELERQHKNTNYWVTLNKVKEIRGKVDGNWIKMGQLDRGVVHLRHFLISLMNHWLRQ